MPTYLGNKLVSSFTSPDEQTITLTSNNTLQTQGVINSNSGSVIKYWTGTRAEYNTIVTKDANTLYNVIDDSVITYSMLELLYPIGSIYIGTMETCPMIVLMPNTTWQLKAQDMVLQGAGTKGAVKTELTQNVKLPDITGSFYSMDTGYLIGAGLGATGAFDSSAYNGSGHIAGTNWSGTRPYGANFKASRSSSVYSGDDTDTEIQQPAYLVNIWERVA